MKVCPSKPFLLYTYLLIMYHNRFHFRLYWINVCWVYLRILKPVVVPCRLFIGANPWATLNSALTPQGTVLVTFVDSSSVRENHWKSFPLFLIYYWFCSQQPLLFKQLFSLKGYRLKQFVFSGQISLTAVVKHNIIDSPLVNGKWLSLLG